MSLRKVSSLCTILLALILSGTAWASDINCNGPGDDNCGNNPTTNQGGNANQGQQQGQAIIHSGNSYNNLQLIDRSIDVNVAKARAKSTATANAPTTIEGDNVKVFTSAPSVNPAALAAGMCGWGIGASGSDGKAGAGLGFSKSYECKDFIRTRAAQLLLDVARDTNDGRFAEAALILISNNKEVKKALLQANILNKTLGVSSSQSSLTPAEKVRADHALRPDSGGSIDQYDAVRPDWYHNLAR